jgi:PAS domain S-box-containing protein
MKEEYKDKTKEQLINDLVELRQQIAELEKEKIERKRAEEERNKLLKAIETTKEAINITTPDTVMIYTNDAMDELFGYKKGELIGKQVSILNAGPAQEAKEVPKPIVDAIKKKGVWEGEIHNKRKVQHSMTSPSVSGRRKR